MRLTSLLILLAIVGGGIYVVFYTDLLKRGEEWARGYKDATTPLEAMDSFKRAITDRRFTMAAKYCTGDYAEQLKRADEAARAMGTLIDGLYTKMQNKGYESDKSVATLNKLDLFPTWFKVKGTPEQHGDDKA